LALLLHLYKQHCKSKNALLEPNTNAWKDFVGSNKIVHFFLWNTKLILMKKINNCSALTTKSLFPTRHDQNDGGYVWVG